MLAKFYKLKWDVSPECSKMFDSIDSELSVKTKTDGNSNKQTGGGSELRNLSLPYKLVAGAGVDILKELETIKTMQGVIAPLYIDRRRLFSTLFMLTDCQCSNMNLTPTGQIVDCEISLSFVEIRISTGSGGGLKVLYNDVDITKDITIVECEHEMNAEDRPDEIKIKFSDNNHLWDGWQPNNHDTIKVIDGIAKTGKMFIQSVLPENGYMNLTGSSVPDKMRKVAKENNKSWNNAKFLQVITEIAGRNNLGVENYDIENRTIPFLEQENMSDLQFISERCELEGCAFVIYDGKIILYSPEAIEKSTPVKTITVKDDTGYKYDDNSINAYGACEVDNGSVSGFASAEINNENVCRKILQGYIDNSAEGNLYAKNILAKANRALKTGNFQSDIMRDLSAASIVTLKTATAASNDGNVFYTKIRHDYVKKKTNHFFRFLK